jgi:hypothetical protein
MRCKNGADIPRFLNGYVARIRGPLFHLAATLVISQISRICSQLKMESEPTIFAEALVRSTLTDCKECGGMSSIDCQECCGSGRTIGKEGCSDLASACWKCAGLKVQPCTKCSSTSLKELFQKLKTSNSASDLAKLTAEGVM